MMFYGNRTFWSDPALQEAIAVIEPPRYRREETGESEYRLTETKNGNYEDTQNRVSFTVEQKSDTLFYIRRSWTNLSDVSVKIQTVFTVRSLFAADHYLIPCVNINGNEFGAGLEPKGLLRDGKKWIFGYDRESIPSCTLVENKDFASALFVSDESAVSLQSSCSLTKNEDGTFLQEIYHPVIESPLTYIDRDQYGPEYQSYLTLAAGETFVTGFYLQLSHPRWEKFGICDTLDSALTLFGDPLPYAKPDREKIWERSICFAKSLVTDYKGKKGFIIGFLPDGNGGFVYRGDNCFELGWCGQNILFCRMLIEDHLRYRHPENLALALEILDTRAALCTAKNGLLAAQLKDFERMDEAVSDTCNMGYGAYEYLCCYELLKQNGIEKPQYFEVGKGLCDFFCTHFSEKFGFGKAWRLDGVCVDEGGSVGAFVIPAMVKLYAMTGEEKYLTTAERALDFYVKRDLDQFVSAAGALDTCCVDKESSFPFLMSAVMLYGMTQKEIYRTVALKAAYYITSWMYHYQPVYDANSDVMRNGMSVKGLTAVSTQHQCLDSYAALAVPYIRRVGEIAKDERFTLRAEMMWRSVLQFIGNGEWEVHGRVRRVGSANEVVVQCRWFWDGKDRGSLNDWLVAWPCAFRLSVLASEFQKEERDLVK